MGAINGILMGVYAVVTDPLKNHKVTKPALNVGLSLVRR